MSSRVARSAYASVVAVVTLGLLTGCGPLLGAIHPSPSPTGTAVAEEESPPAPLGFTDADESFAYEWIMGEDGFVAPCETAHDGSCLQMHVFAKLPCEAAIAVRADAVREKIVVGSGIGTMGPLKRDRIGLVEVVFSEPLKGGEELEVHDILCVGG